MLEDTFPFLKPTFEMFAVGRDPVFKMGNAMPDQLTIERGWTIGGWTEGIQEQGNGGIARPTG